ncbi:hypothetical protein RI367_002497 [Sorochytrium milnesiophthora]
MTTQRGGGDSHAAGPTLAAAAAAGTTRVSRRRLAEFEAQFIKSIAVARESLNAGRQQISAGIDSRNALLQQWPLRDGLPVHKPAPMSMTEVNNMVEKAVLVWHNDAVTPLCRSLLDDMEETWTSVLALEQKVCGPMESCCDAAAKQEDHEAGQQDEVPEPADTEATGAGDGVQVKQEPGQEQQQQQSEPPAPQTLAESVQLRLKELDQVHRALADFTLQQEQFAFYLTQYSQGLMRNRHETDERFEKLKANVAKTESTYASQYKRLGEAKAERGAILSQLNTMERTKNMMGYFIQTESANALERLQSDVEAHAVQLVTKANAPPATLSAASSRAPTPVESPATPSHRPEAVQPAAPLVPARPISSSSSPSASLSPTKPIQTARPLPGTVMTPRPVMPEAAASMLARYTDVTPPQQDMTPTHANQPTSNNSTPRTAIVLEVCPKLPVPAMAPDEPRCGSDRVLLAESSNRAEVVRVYGLVRQYLLQEGIKIEYHEDLCDAPVVAKGGYSLIHDLGKSILFKEYRDPEKLQNVIREVVALHVMKDSGQTPVVHALVENGRRELVGFTMRSLGDALLEGRRRPARNDRTDRNDRYDRDSQHTNLDRMDPRRHRLVLLRQLTKLISELHRHGICHLDLCEQNVVVNWRGQFGLTLSIIDYGSCILLSSILQFTPYLSESELQTLQTAKSSYETRRVINSPECLRPELYGKPLDDAFFEGCDLWSLGMLCISILSNYGRMSIDELDPSQLTTLLWEHRITNNKVKQCIRRLLSTNPEDRPAALTIYNTLMTVNEDELDAQPAQH